MLGKWLGYFTYNVQTKVAQLEQQLHMGWSNDVHDAWEQSKTELHQVEAWECEMLCNKARLDWNTNGDRNTKFFHVFIKE